MLAVKLPPRHQTIAGEASQILVALDWLGGFAEVRAELAKALAAYRKDRDTFNELMLGDAVETAKRAIHKRASRWDNAT
jgi:hypothetical protein